MFKHNHILSLDGIRGFAVLLVVIHHLFIAIFENTSLIPTIIKSMPASGVDLFFVLSGFLIGGIIIDQHTTKNFWKRFMLRRVGRIFPVYFLIIISFSLGMFFLKNKWFFDDFLLADPLPITPYFLFLQSYTQGIANLSGPKWVAMTWTLSVEEQFYIFVPLIALFFGKRGIFIAVILAIIFAPIVRYWALHTYGYYAGYMFFPARMDSLAIGVASAFLVRNKLLYTYLSKTKILYLVSLILLILFNTKISLGGYIIDKYTFRALFFASLILIVVIKKNFLISLLFENKIIVFFGSISYGLYMYHQLINGLFHGIVNNGAPKIYDYYSFIISISVFLFSILIATISLKYFEIPIRTYFKNRSNKFLD